MRVCAALTAAFLLVWFTGPLWAANPPPLSNPAPAAAMTSGTPVPVATPATTAPPAPRIEKPPAPEDSDKRIALLKQQVEITRGFQSDVLSTVNTALQVVFGLAVVLVGYNWITTRQLYNREKQAFEAALTNKMTARVTEAEQALRTEAQQERTRGNDALEAVRIELQTRIKESAAAQRETTATALSEFSRKIAQLVDDARGSAQKISHVQMKLDRFLMREEVEAKRWSVAITNAIELIEAAIDTGSDWYLEEALQSLSQAIDEGGKFTKSEIQIAPALMKKVPEQFHKLADQIAQKLPNVKIFE